MLKTKRWGGRGNKRCGCPSGQNRLRAESIRQGLENTGDRKFYTGTGEEIVTKRLARIDAWGDRRVLHVLPLLMSSTRMLEKKKGYSRRSM